MAGVSTGPYPDRRIRVGVYLKARDALVVNAVLEPGTDVCLAADEANGLPVPGWSEPPLVVVSGGTLLHLGPGMRLIMCDEAGDRRVTGTFEELQEAGMTFPTTVPVSRLNVRAREGVTVLLEFVP